MVGLAFSGVAAKLIWLHALGPFDGLRSEIAENRRFETETKGARGRVVDRNGRIMALDLGRANVAADPSYLAQKNTNVLDVCRFLCESDKIRSQPLSGTFTVRGFPDREDHSDHDPEQHAGT